MDGASRDYARSTPYLLRSRLFCLRRELIAPRGLCLLKCANYLLLQAKITSGQLL
jgi:hypothetical protein